MKKQSALILLAALIFALSAGTGNAAQRDRSAAVSRHTRTPELGSVDRFREAFQNDEGKVRLVALISPT